MKTTGLTIGFANHILFENLNLSLKEGELVCFMGPNGIGKSTLIKALAGLHKPLKGDVSVIDPTKIALVLTDRIQSAQMTVYDLVTYGRYPYLNWKVDLSANDHRIVSQAIAEVHIENLTHQKLSELSDGQMQLAMIARALAQQTPYLLLDEPTAHLDLNNRVEMMSLLRRLCRTSGKSVLLATHELDLALQTSDWVWLADGNKSIKTGVPEDLVLNGSFDSVFKLKGFDLKTGKVFHEIYGNRNVQLTGEGPEYLWTKNALERNGFEVKNDSPVSIEIIKADRLSWKVKSRQGAFEFHKVEDILKKLHQDFADKA